MGRSRKVRNEHTHATPISLEWSTLIDGIQLPVRQLVACFRLLIAMDHHDE